MFLIISEIYLFLYRTHVKLSTKNNICMQIIVITIIGTIKLIYVYYFFNFILTGDLISQVPLSLFLFTLPFSIT